MPAKNRELPNERGYFGQFGGKFVPETLMPALSELEEAYRQTQAEPEISVSRTPGPELSRPYGVIGTDTSISITQDIAVTPTAKTGATGLI